MSTRGTTTDSATRPSWLPPDKTLDAVPAGRWWDAVTIEGNVGHLVAQLLKDAAGTRTGPIICDPLGPTPKLYFLVPTGTADGWNEPCTEVLGECCYVVLTGSLKADTVGVHWVVPPYGGRLVRPAQLRRVLAEAHEATP
jgi:hypothetical protein